MKIKKIVIGAVSSALLISSLLCAVSCDDLLNGDSQPSDSQTTDTQSSGTDTEASTEINYNELKATDYVKKLEYKGMKIVLEDEDADKERELWNAIYLTAQIASYPEDKVQYYFEQTKKAYMHAVAYDEEDYKTLLKNRGTSEAIMLEEAREMVKEDLVYRYIVEKEKIVLTDEDKSLNFDKYVKKYAYEFSKSEKYIIAEMSEYIYESMLYDKTVEFLILNNQFEVSEKSESETTENAKR